MAIDVVEQEHLIPSAPVRVRQTSRRRYIIPLCLATVVFFFIFVISRRSKHPETMGRENVRYSTVPGYFLQDDPKTDPIGFDYTTTNFGLIDRSYEGDAQLDSTHEKTQWQRFANEVHRLNTRSNDKTQYKLFFMGRHGEGDHNVAETYYGTKAWDCYWSLQEGNGTKSWLDAHLTPTGEAQATKAHDFWAHLLKEQKIPPPEIYYVSPLRRCLATAHLTFNHLPLPSSHPFKPIVKELFREVIGAHTCDQRSTRSVIEKEWPDVVFEQGFREDDELFKSEWRESNDAHDQRSRKALDGVFGKGEDGEGKSWVSLSSHSGAIASLLRVVGHRPFTLGTGQVIPVLIKAEFLDGDAPDEKPAPWVRIIPCEKPPPPAI